MLISYKYKFYRSKKNKALEYMMSEAAFVWNHALALQKRYYSIAKQFGWETKYIPYVRMAHHFAKRIKRTRLSSATVQELLMRQDFRPRFLTKDFCDQHKRRLFTKAPELYPQFAEYGKSEENWYFVDGEIVKYINGKRI